MTYNVWGRPWPLPRKPRRFKKIPKVLVQTGADIIGLQETFTRSARVFEKMREYPYFAKHNKRSLIKTGAGLTTISKFPIEKKKVANFGKCAGTDCLARKGVLFTRIILSPGLKLDVYNTHLNAAGDDDIRAYQVRKIAKFMDKHSKDYPVILLGDMNQITSHSPYKLFSELMDLSDSYLEFVRTVENPSPNQRDGHTNQRVKEGKGKRIDYIFYKNDLRLLNSQVNMNEAQTRLSDHDGVISTFSISDN